MRFEGGHWKNTADYNPLNTTLNRPGAKSMNSVGVKAYTSWEQGLDATISTLTGASAQSRGYTALVDALKKGNKEDILTAINNSAWRTGKADGSGAYKGMTNSSGGNYGSGERDAKSGQISGIGEGGGRVTLSSILKEAKDSASGGFLSSFLKGQEGTSKPSAGVTNNTYNYGGVTVSLSGGSSPEANVAALKAALSSNETLSKAAGS